jgi:hypothetical protein
VLARIVRGHAPGRGDLPRALQPLPRDGERSRPGAGARRHRLTGFVVDDAHVWARPVGVTIARDGALLVTEDGNGTIWRVS